MNAKNVASTTKDAIVVAAFAYTCVQAGRGWYYLGKEAAESIKDRRNKKYTITH